ncbi:uncharacterized protein [Clytia hemisphaerica]|uniref:uncharacterized protein n=1 Tax=Clytia hemisphaerica TaxID=252671 RepID=UPI0034D70461
MGNSNSTSTTLEAENKTFRLKVRNDTSSVADVLVKAHDNLEKTNLKRKQIPPKTIVSMRMPTTFQLNVACIKGQEATNEQIISSHFIRRSRWETATAHQLPLRPKTKPSGSK